MNIPIWFRISPRFQSCYQNFNPTLHHWATAFFQMGWENTQFEFILKNIWTLPFCTEFPTWLKKLYRNLNPTILHWAKGFFLSLYGLRKYTIWVYLNKYFVILIVWYFVQNFPPVLEMISQIQSPFQLGYGIFKKMIRRIIWIYFPGFLRVFMHRKTYSLNYWTRLPSVSPPIGICNPFLNRPRVPGLFMCVFPNLSGHVFSDLPRIEHWKQLKNKFYFFP